jgi:hypothetical protein
MPSWQVAGRTLPLPLSHTGFSDGENKKKCCDSGLIVSKCLHRRASGGLKTRLKQKKKRVIFRFSLKLYLANSEF